MTFDVFAMKVPVKEQAAKLRKWPINLSEQQILRTHPDQDLPKSLGVDGQQQAVPSWDDAQTTETNDYLETCFQMS